MQISRPGTLRWLGLAAVIFFANSSFAGTLFSTRFDGGSGRPGEWQIYNASSDCWTLFSGQLQTGNGDNITQGDRRSYALIGQPQTASWNNYVVSADVWMSQRNGTLGLVGRWQSTTQHYEGTIEVVENQRTARIERVSSRMGSAIPERQVLAQGSAANGLAIPSIAGGGSPRDACRLSLMFNNDEITFLVDGKVLLKATDSQIKTGSAGLLNYANYAYYDNVSVETLDSMNAVAAIPSATPRPRFTPAATPTPVPTPAFSTIKRAIPNSILQNVDEAELVQRLTKEERNYYDHISDEDKVTLLRNLRTRLTSATGGAANSEMAAQLEALKKQMELLSNAQKKLSSPSKNSEQDKLISDGLVSIEALQDQRNYTAALIKANELLQRFSGNPALLMKKRTLERLSAGSYEGYDEQLAKNEITVKRLMSQAQQQEKQGSLEAALMSWTTIQSMSPAKDEWITQADAKRIQLDAKVEAQSAERDKAFKSISRNKWIVYAAIAISIGIGFIVMIVLSRFQKRSQARDEEILSQVKDLTQPLVDMQAEIRQLTGTGALALPGSTGSNRALPMHDDDHDDDDHDLDFDEEPTPLSGMDAFDLPVPEDTVKAAVQNISVVIPAATPVISTPPAPVKSEPAAEVSLPKSDAFAIDDSFDNLMATPLKESADEPDSGMEDLRMDEFALGGSDLFGGDLAMTGVASRGSSIDLDSFSVSDASNSGFAPSAPKKMEPVQAPLAQEKKDAPVIDLAAENKNAPLDLGLDDFLAPDTDGKNTEHFDLNSQTAKLSPVTLDLGEDQALNIEYDPMANLGAADDFKLELMEEEQHLPEQAPKKVTRAQSPEAIPIIATQQGTPTQATAREAAPVDARTTIVAPGIVYGQSFENEPIGQQPKSWSGEQKNNVLFQVADSNGRRVLRYFKNAGTDSVHFFCRFPNVGGVISVEFDINCPQKNKYLLGLYIERDSNYNQAIRTVVHCLDPAAASIRMQNEPVEYKLGEWRHVRYVVDLGHGTIDGFIDREQILTQQTFVNKPSSINTLSIRDNHATTGELLLDNIKIEKLS